MNKTFYKYMLGGLLVATLGGATSCSDILDEVPDNRTEIDTPNKVKLLMTSSYPTSSPAWICELSSDNLVDNNAYLKAKSVRQSALYTFHDEAFKWEDINNYTSSTPDTPYKVWNDYYNGIATCNHALKAIDELLAKNPSLKDDLDPYRGEALVNRAFLHFVLVNVFSKAWRNSELSRQDLGIPYVTEVEDKVFVDYKRPSVDSVYNCIERDLLEGIELVDDSYYATRAYHFNKAAANAFAARFYLYRREYDKVVKYATEALGNNPGTTLRNWTTINTNTIDTRTNWFFDESASANFMIQSTYSLLARDLMASRFVSNGDAQEVCLYGDGPCWNSILPCYASNLLLSTTYGQDYGVFPFRVVEQFEYTDKIAGIGFVHTLYTPLTAEETLLCRAEAELFLGDRDACVSDLNAWAVSKGCTTELTAAKIRSFYTSGKTGFVCDLNNELMSPDFIVSSTQKPFVDCILHFRRIETFCDGLRWFDIKRYGIAVTHEYRDPNEDVVHTDVLNWDDARRALQIPNDVIAAGFVSNDRAQTAEATTSSSSSSVAVVKR
jgi:hypothetical protein